MDRALKSLISCFLSCRYFLYSVHFSDYMSFLLTSQNIMRCFHRRISTRKSLNSWTWDESASLFIMSPYSTTHHMQLLYFLRSCNYSIWHFHYTLIPTMIHSDFYSITMSSSTLLSFYSRPWSFSLATFPSRQVLPLLPQSFRRQWASALSLDFQFSCWGSC